MKVFFVVCVCVALVGCYSRGRYEPIASTPKLVPYQYPFVSPGAMFAELPPAVQHTLRAQAGAAEISEVSSFIHQNTRVYKVWFAHGLHSPPLMIAEDGSVLHHDFTIVHSPPSLSKEHLASGAKVFDEFMPKPVQVAIQDQGGLSNVTGIAKQPWGNRFLYIVGYRNPEEHATLYITSDGTVHQQSPR